MNDSYDQVLSLQCAAVWDLILLVLSVIIWKREKKRLWIFVVSRLFLLFHFLFLECPKTK